MKRCALFFLLCSVWVSLYAQDIAYARKVVNDLCSEEMAGRGYVKDGGQKAADYIKKEYEKAGLKYFDKGYFQSYGFPVVAFPYTVEIEVEGRVLMPGEDYIVSAGCPVINGTFDLFYLDSSHIDNQSEFDKLKKLPLYKTFLVVDELKGKQFIHPERAELILSNGLKARGLAYAALNKLTWSATTEWDKFPIIYFSKGSIKRHQLSFRINVESEIRSHQAHNVIGYIKGSVQPDSFIVYSAHYDHLGMMGRWAIFPGANDNASGVAMMLDLMKYYSVNKPKYSIAFIAFSGEEAGLFGSYYYTEHPLFPLNQIAMLINLDLMGTGDKGMTVVNATLFPKEFDELQMLNLDGNYLTTVNPRGKAQNSDHYYFSEKGVKAFFFYLMGEYKYYHDVFDTPEALTFSKYKEAFSLIRDFAEAYQNKGR